MDDFYLSADTISEAIQHLEDLRCVLQKGGFNLTKLVSPNETIFTAVRAEQRALSPAEIPHAGQGILGKPWTLENGTVSANVSKLFELKELPSTQRTLLRIISSQFDPLGITAPIVIRLLIIQQSLWRNGMTKSPTMKCRNKTPSFKSRKLFVLQSYLDISSNMTTHNFLHIFCDASYTPLSPLPISFTI